MATLPCCRLTFQPDSADPQCEMEAVGEQGEQAPRTLEMRTDPRKLKAVDPAWAMQTVDRVTRLLGYAFYTK